jgi:hypothetical protein
MVNNREGAILMVIPLLAIILIFSSSATYDTFALEKSSIRCIGKGNETPFKQVSCCQTWTYRGGLEIVYCTDCDNTNPPSNCGPRYTSREGLPLPPIQPNGNLTFTQSNNTNNTKPSSGLLNGRVPTTNTLNAPITTTGGITSNPSSNNTSTSGSLNTIRGASSATRSLINGNSPAASGRQPPQPPYSTPINSSSAAMKAARSLYSPTGGCIPGGSTCVPCDIGLTRIGANCIPSGDWHPTNGLPPSSTLQQQQPTTPPSTSTTLPTSAGLLNKVPTDHTERCFAIVKGGGPVCNPGRTTTTTNQQTTPTPTSTTPSQHHHKGNNNPQGGQESTSSTTPPSTPTTKKGKASKTG